MIFRAYLLIATSLWTVSNSYSNPSLITYDWPTATGEAIESDYYSVRISNGLVSKEVKVLQSSSWEEPGGGPEVFRGRTFSWASFSSDFKGPLEIEVTKIFGEGSIDVEIFPSGYQIKPVISKDGKVVKFSLKQSRYVSINFKSKDNQHTTDGIIRHMLMIFADPLETDPPLVNVKDTVVFDQDTTQDTLKKAQVIFFKPGFYSLKKQLADGILHVSKGQTVYLSGGAFVEGRIEGKNVNKVTIKGRGVLSGRNLKWRPGLPISALIHLVGANNKVEGIVACDNNMHGIVPGVKSEIRNVKLWGWHYNNDGFRPWGGKVDHCFLRPTDDAFYVGRNVEVTDTVIWQSFNGAIVTCGWGSAEKPYNSSKFLMKNCHIIYPEWNGIGNNNGVLASQLPYSAQSQDIRFEDIRVDGNISALTNLKRNFALEKVGKPGGIRNVSFKNVTVTGRQVIYNFDRSKSQPSYSLIKGEDGFHIENVLFDNVRIGGVLLTEKNRSNYFQIDSSTTQGVRFCDSNKTK